SAPGAPKRTAAPETPAPAQPSTPLQPGGAVQPGPAAPAGAVAAAGGGQPGPVAPTAVQPQAVKPQATKARPVAKKAPSTRQMNPGDKVCGQCGEGNDPSRKFCRRCGGSLVEAAVFQLPWYKALWRRLFTKKQRQAGDRPKMRRRAIGGHGGWLTRAIGTIIVLAIIAVAVLSFVGPWHKSLHAREVRYYHDVVGQVHPTYNQFFAHAATATSSAAGHPPINAIDGELNTSWQSAGTVTGQSLTVQFAQATNVAKIGLHIGDQDTPQSYETEPRPEKIQLVFQGAKTVTKTLTVTDSASFQTFSVSADGATSVTFNIQSVYAATGSGQNISIAEIEFFTKS
ncbi:MAG: hypothetical protein KGQ66_17335, partial [Acidobacteriota bacterium]|nr:hypothetical protein [Acidobacteriota bacterium]